MQEKKQVDQVGREEAVLGTDHILQVSSSSTLKAEPKPIPMHRDPRCLLPLIFSTFCPLHKHSCAMFVHWLKPMSSPCISHWKILDHLENISFS